MTDHAHDVGLMAVFIDGVAQGLVVDGETAVGVAIGCIPVANSKCEHL